MPILEFQLGTVISTVDKCHGTKLKPGGLNLDLFTPKLGLFLSHRITLTQQAQFAVDLEETVAVLNGTSGLITKDFVHLLKGEILGFGDNKVDKVCADETHQTEEDEGTVAHRTNHVGCGLADLVIVSTQKKEWKIGEISYSEVVEPVG